MQWKYQVKVKNDSILKKGGSCSATITRTQPASSASIDTTAYELTYVQSSTGSKIYGTYSSDDTVQTYVGIAYLSFGGLAWTGVLGHGESTHSINGDLSGVSKSILGVTKKDISVIQQQGSGGGTGNHVRLNKTKFQIAVHVKSKYDASSITSYTISPYFGDTIKVTWNNESASVLTHKVVLQIGTHSVNQQFTTNIKEWSFQIPISWMDAAESTQAVGSIKLYTYYNKSQMGEPSIQTFNVVIPDSYIPSVTLQKVRTVVNDNDVIRGWDNVYLQHHTGIILTATGTPSDINHMIITKSQATEYLDSTGHSGYIDQVGTWLASENYKTWLYSVDSDCELYFNPARTYMCLCVYNSESEIGASPPGAYYTRSIDGSMDTMPYSSNKISVNANKKIVICTTGDDDFTCNISTYGSSIRNYTFSCPSGVSGTQNNNIYTITKITKSGDLTFSVTCTDSRGVTSPPAQVSVSVVPYWNPTIGTYNAYRCFGDDGHTPSDTGKYVYAKITGSVAPCGYVNSEESTIPIARNTKTLNTYIGDAVLSDGTLSNKTPLYSNMTDGYVYCSDKSLSANITYYIMFQVVDAIGQRSTMIVQLTTAPYAIHIKNGGLAVAFGKAAQKDHRVEVSEDWTPVWGDCNMMRYVVSANPPSESYQKETIFWLRPTGKYFSSSS